MSDECTHEKARVTVDTENGPERVCPLCESIDLQTLDGGST